MSTCSIHSAHSIKAHVIDSHHIIPKSWGGATTARNLVELCPTAHMNVHAFLDLLITHGGRVPSDIAEHWFYRERELALQGYSEAMALGLTIRRTL